MFFFFITRRRIKYDPNVPKPHPIWVPAFYISLLALIFNGIATFTQAWTADGLGIAPYDQNYLTSYSWASTTFILMCTSIGVNIVVLILSITLLLLIEKRTGFTNNIRVCFWIITALTFLCAVLVVTAFIVFDVGLCCKLEGYGNLSFGLSIYFLWVVVVLYALSFLFWLLFVWKHFYHYIPPRFRQQQGY